MTEEEVEGESSTTPLDEKHTKKICWKRRQRVFNVENVGVGPR